MQLILCSPIFCAIVLLVSVNCTIIIVEDAKGIDNNQQSSSIIIEHELHCSITAHIYDENNNLFRNRFDEWMNFIGIITFHYIYTVRRYTVWFGCTPYMADVHWSTGTSIETDFIWSENVHRSRIELSLCARSHSLSVIALSVTGRQPRNIQLHT